MRFFTASTALLSLSLAFVSSSCSSLPSFASSQPKLLPKKSAEALAKLTPKKSKPAKTATVAYNKFLPAPASTGLKASAEVLPKDKHGRATYDFETRNRVVRTTAYSCAENEPGAVGCLNAAGSVLKYGSTVRSAAADWSRYPLGTKFKIKGLPYTYVVDDYGSALVGTNTIDIYHPNLSLMNKWGTREAEISVIQWGSWERTLKLLKGRRGYSHCRRMHDAALAHVEAGRVILAQNEEQQ